MASLYVDGFEQCLFIWYSDFQYNSGCKEIVCSENPIQSSLYGVMQMRSRVGATILVGLVLVCLIMPHVSAKTFGSATCDVTANTADADIPAINNYNWDPMVDGTTIVISIDCSMDDNNVAVNVRCHFSLSVSHFDRFDQFIETKSDTFSNPSWDSSDSTSSWPIGRYANDTISVTFSTFTQHDYFQCTVLAVIYNDSAAPPVDDLDIETFTVTAI